MSRYLSKSTPASPHTPPKMEACEFKKYGCSEHVKDMDKHLRDAMPTHLQLVIEKFEQQIEMNTFMMAHFTEQMEEQVDKSMQLVQHVATKQAQMEEKLEGLLKAPKPEKDESIRNQKTLVLKELKDKQKQQREVLDLMRVELEQKMMEQSIQINVIQDRVETNANVIVERMYSQAQQLDEMVKQRVTILEQKMDSKEQQHAAQHTLMQTRFEQAITHQQAPLMASITRMEQRVDRYSEEQALMQTQAYQARENSRVLQRQQERLEAEVQIIQVKVDRPTHRRSASMLRVDDEPGSPGNSPQQLVLSPKEVRERDIDSKRLQSVEAGVKKVEQQYQQLDALLQQNQHNAEEALRIIQDKLKEHGELIKLDEKERERQVEEQEKSMKLEEKEREELEVRMKRLLTQQIEGTNVEVKKLEKLQQAMETQIQQIQHDARERREDIDKLKIQRMEAEEKIKAEIRENKDEFEKERRRRREEKDSEDREKEKLRAEIKDIASKQEQASEKSKLSSAVDRAKPDEKVKPRAEEDKKVPEQEPKPKSKPKPSDFEEKLVEKELDKKVQSSAANNVAAKAREEPAPVSSQDKAKIVAESAASDKKQTPEPSGPYERAILWEYDPISDKWTRLLCKLNIEKAAFAEGALRSAFHAQAVGAPTIPDEAVPAHPAELYPAKDQTSVIPPGGSFPARCEAAASLKDKAKFVVKIYKKESEQKATRELYFEDVKMQMVCRDWGNRFNQKKPPKRIEFLMAWVLELVDRSTPVLCNMEPLLVGEFKKNNSNYGAVLNTRSTPQSFSHFTYEHSKKNMIIVDIQGVEDHYTDPQIHTADGKGYGLGNLGRNGIQRFLSTHKCNAVCALLNLQPIGMGSTRGKPQLRGTMVMPDIVSNLPPSPVGLRVGSRALAPYDLQGKELKVVHTLQAHRDRVSAVCVLSDGITLCTASADNTIKVYDTSKGWRFTDTLTGHKKPVECLCSNDKYLFSGSADQTVKVWDPKRDFRCIATLMGHKGEISSVCVTDKYIFSASFDKSIKVWDMTTFQEVKTMESHSKSIKCMVVSGDYLFSGSNDLMIYVYDLATLCPIFSMEGHEEWVKALTISGTTLISGSHDSNIKVWDLAEFQCISTLKGHRDVVVCLLAHGRLLYSGSEDNSIKVWDLSSLDLLYSVPKAHQLGIQCFCLLGDKLVSCAVDGSIKVWDWVAK